MTGIQWTDEVWNPTTGCDKVSPGCGLPRFDGDGTGGCYAMAMAKRLKGMGQAKYQNDGDPKTSGPGFGLAVHPDALGVPLRWREPRRVFVNSMSDLFHESVPDEYIARVWQVMATTPQHTYQILTKRHARMRAWVNRCKTSPGGWITHDGTDPARACDGTGVIVGYHPPAYPYGTLGGPRGGKPRHKPQPVAYGWPLPNVWLGVSVEDQKWADIRIPALLDTPAAVRFISAEPLLGPVNLAPWLPVAKGAFCETHWSWMCGGDISGGECRRTRLSWVIAGGESGPGARPMEENWVRAITWQCRTTRVPVFVKQLGSVLGRQIGAGSKGGDIEAFPEDLQVRQFPVAAKAEAA